MQHLQNRPGTRKLSTPRPVFMPEHRLLHQNYVLALPDILHMLRALTKADLSPCIDQSPDLGSIVHCLIH